MVKIVCLLVRIVVSKLVRVGVEEVVVVIVKEIVQEHVKVVVDMVALVLVQEEICMFLFKVGDGFNKRKKRRMARWYS